MKLNLKIAFNSQTNSQILIENAPYIPGIGEIVNIHPADYFTDPILIRNLNLYAEKGIWKVGFKTVDFSKDLTTVLIVLEEEEHYNQNSDFQNGKVIFTK